MTATYLKIVKCIAYWCTETYWFVAINILIILKLSDLGCYIILKLFDLQHSSYKYN